MIMMKYGIIPPTLPVQRMIVFPPNWRLSLPCRNVIGFFTTCSHLQTLCVNISSRTMNAKRARVDSV